MDNAIRPQIGAQPAAPRTDGPSRPAIPQRHAIGAGQRTDDAAAGSARADRGAADGNPLALDALLDEGLGPVDLPPPIELMAALEAAERHAPLADRAVPGLGRLIHAVIGDERFKLARTMDLGR